MSYGDKVVQDRVREKGGLEVVLGLCAMDEGNPCELSRTFRRTEGREDERTRRRKRWEGGRNRRIGEEKEGQRKKRGKECDASKKS